MTQVRSVPTFGKIEWVQKFEPKTLIFQRFRGIKFCTHFFSGNGKLYIIKNFFIGENVCPRARKIKKVVGTVGTVGTSIYNTIFFNGSGCTHFVPTFGNGSEKWVQIGKE